MVKIPGEHALLGDFSYLYVRNQNMSIMKVAIIGAGNMGGAIACGLAASGHFAEGEIVCSNRSSEKLERLREKHPSITVTTDNAAAVKEADVVIIAVKPWYTENVIRQIRPALDASRQLLVSVVAGVSFAQLTEWLQPMHRPWALFRAIPNTAVELGCGMTFVTASNASEEQMSTVMSLFDMMGKSMAVDEKQLETGMILASCGIAFALRYIRAAAEGGVELGMPASQASRIVAQTMIGAAQLILHNGAHPEQEIDRVTTAGGITIRGLNEMEHAGFSSAVIRGLKACK